jgi:hypothetical protein
MPDLEDKTACRKRHTEPALAQYTLPVSPFVVALVLSTTR